MRVVGMGILQGLAETARNFLGSYVDARRLTTVQYPEERVRLPEAARQFPFLVYDGTDAEQGLRCVACKICEKECPPQCIYIVAQRDSKGRIAKRPEVFDLDVSVCMSCQICVEVCPFEAIKMDVEHEWSRTDRFGGLLLRKAQLAKPNAYYHRIHPTEAAEVDARLNEDLAKAAAHAAHEAEPHPAAAAPAPTPSA